jgi:hypothetical protein
LDLQTIGPSDYRIDIPAHFLNNLSEELSPFLSFFFQLSIDNGNIPVDWKQANVVPIFLKRDKHSVVIKL